MSFDAVVNGHHIKMDVPKEHSGNDTGPTPKPLLLVSLTGCTGMDVVSILKKMKVKDYSFEMDAEGVPTVEHPMVYESITIHFRFTGSDLPEDKIIKAVTISSEKYCAVNAMLKKSSDVIRKIYINDKEVQ